MKICVLTHTFPRFKDDTVAPFMEGLAQGIALNNNQVFVLVPYDPRFKNKSKSFKIITYKYIYPSYLHKLGFSNTLNNDMTFKPIVYLLGPLMLFFGIIALFKLVKKEKIDLINPHWILPNGFIGAVVSQLTRVPLVSTLPGSDVYLAFKNKLFFYMTRFATKTSVFITSNSPQLLLDLSKIEQIDQKSKAIIYGVDSRKFKPSKDNLSRIRKKLMIQSKNLVVLSVARLVAKKGIQYLIKASVRILKDNPNVVFLIIGDGAQKVELMDLADKLGVVNSFHFLGAIDYKNLKDYYNVSDIFILPSIRDKEGNLDDQSVSVIEAMACGKPVITTNFPGYHIVVKNGVNGFLTKEKNSRDIEKSLEKVIADKRLRLRMGKRSRKIVLEKFTWEKIGKEYSKLFKKVLVE